MKRPEVMSVFGLALYRISAEPHTRTSFFDRWWDDYRDPAILDGLVSHGFVTYRGERLVLTEAGQRRLAPEM